MRKLIVAVALIVAALAGAMVLRTAGITTNVAGVASDHSHVVSFEEFKRIEMGAGQPSTNLALAYSDTTSVCTQVMTSRWQDRDVLLSVVPASIQDPTLRGQVYWAILGALTPGKLTACVA